MTIEEDYARFLSSQPEEQQRFETVEINHASLPSTIRLVRGPTELTAKDENEISRTYSPVDFNSEDTKNLDDLDQLSSFTLPDIDNSLDDDMDLIDVGSQDKATLTYRIYLSTNLDEIAEGPFVFDLESIAQVKGLFTIRSGIPRLNAKTTGEIFNTTDFPMLRAFQ